MELVFLYLPPLLSITVQIRLQSFFSLLSTLQIPNGQNWKKYLRERERERERKREKERGEDRQRQRERNRKKRVRYFHERYVLAENWKTFGVWDDIFPQLKLPFSSLKYFRFISHFAFPFLRRRLAARTTVRVRRIGLWFEEEGNAGPSVASECCRHLVMVQSQTNNFIHENTKCCLRLQLEVHRKIFFFDLMFERFATSKMKLN